MIGGICMTNPKLYRRRFIPKELIYLKDDEIITMEDELIITKWNTLHPRKDIARGISAYYLDKGIKVSKLFNEHDELVYWYCDIIQMKKDNEKNTVIIEDLLIDVLLYEDGTMRILDLDELAAALEQKLISTEEATYALKVLDSLLQIIYTNNFYKLQELINNL
jgi:predicted RNA-binding protein associated with RNAse of E/G family